MQAQCSHAVLFCLVTSYYDSCCSYFSLFFVSWAVSSFHEAEFMSGEGHIQFNVYGPGPFNEGRPRAGGLSALPGSAQVMFLVFSLEAHGGRKESPRGTLVIMMFSFLHFPLVSFISLRLLFYSLHHLLCFANTM
jgi:hypothetical protein